MIPICRGIAGAPGPGELRRHARKICSRSQGVAGRFGSTTPIRRSIARPCARHRATLGRRGGRRRCWPGAPAGRAAGHRRRAPRDGRTAVPRGRGAARHAAVARRALVRPRPGTHGSRSRHHLARRDPRLSRAAARAGPRLSASARSRPAPTGSPSAARWRRTSTGAAWPRSRSSRISRGWRSSRADRRGRALSAAKRIPALFRHVVGGYGLFGVVTAVTLRLVPRVKVERRVARLDIDGLMDAFDERIAAGHLYGDFQFATRPQVRRIPAHRRVVELPAGRARARAFPTTSAGCRRATGTNC